jgi:rubrerythrin
MMNEEAATAVAEGKGSESSSKKIDCSPDIFARIVLFMVRWRSQVPGWRVETMGRLVTSELEGIKLIEGAIPRVSDVRMRKILAKHLEDERRHHRVFNERYEALQLEAGAEVQPPAPALGQKKRFNILELVAYLETQETRAIALLETYADLFEGDEESVHWIRRNIKDELFHATWTHMQLERWIKDGLVEEVRQARVEANLVDRRAFWIQFFSFLRVMPSLIARGYWPQIFTKSPSPL